MKRSANTLITFSAFFIVFLALCAFAVDFPSMLIARSQLQNATDKILIEALSELSSVNSGAYLDGKIQTLLPYYKYSPIENIEKNSIDYSVNNGVLNVRFRTKAKMPSVFLNVLGVSGMNINATSYARLGEEEINNLMPKILDTNGKIVREGSIIKRDVEDKNNVCDTVLKEPVLGETVNDVKNISISEKVYEKNLPAFYPSSQHPISLGAGGFISIILPFPIKKNSNNKLIINELGLPEGYLVFAGVDNSDLADYPFGVLRSFDNNIHCKADSLIYWVNVSAYASPSTSVKNVMFNGVSSVYGSVEINLNNADLGYVKYIKIVDDKREDAIVSSEPRFV